MKLDGGMKWKCSSAEIGNVVHKECYFFQISGSKLLAKGLRKLIQKSFLHIPKELTRVPTLFLYNLLIGLVVRFARIRLKSRLLM